MLVARLSADLISATRVIVITASLPYDFAYSISIDKNETSHVGYQSINRFALCYSFNRSGPSLEGQITAKMKKMLLRRV